MKSVLIGVNVFVLGCLGAVVSAISHHFLLLAIFGAIFLIGAIITFAGVIRTFVKAEATKHKQIVVYYPGS